MRSHVWSVLLAGGVGSRFWPVSRALRPKQLLDLFGDGPMLRAAYERARPLAAEAIVVTSEALAPAVRALLPEVPGAHVLAEPCGRNTAPAIAWAAKVALAADPDAILMVLPADHHIPDAPAFQASAALALAHARAHLVTIGIVPTHPETGYGYLLRGDTLADGVHRVARFVEKPDLATALGYLADGGYLWNAGMFFMSARLFLDELAAHRPALARAVADAADVPAAFASFESISIDYAVMEPSASVATVPATFAWSDVGSWRSLYDHRGAAPSYHRGDVIERDGSGNVLFADGGLVATVGVSDLVVVHTPDATFVCPRDEAQRAREVVHALERAGRRDLL